jgi:hypothetical protein
VRFRKSGNRQHFSAAGLSWSGAEQSGCQMTGKSPFQPRPQYAISIR